MYNENRENNKKTEYFSFFPKKKQHIMTKMQFYLKT